MLRKLLSLPAFLCLLVSSAYAQTVQFGPRQDIASHMQHLNGLALADFNGDGKLDLAVTDLMSHTVNVYLNSGTGSFGAPVTTTLPGSAFFGLGSLVSGDVNEDGKQDLIVGPIGGSQEDIVLLSNGDGTFTPGQTLMSTFGFTNAYLVDVNGDKHLDLVSGGNALLDVELGDGKGNFTQKPLPAGYTPLTFNTGLTVGDFTGDGHPDFLSTAYNTLQLQFYPGTGDGSFAAPSTIVPGFLSTDGVNLASGDFNGDGKLDVLIGLNYATVLVFGNGDGTFQTGQAQISGPPLPNYPYSSGFPEDSVAVLVAAADFDGNGTTDALAVDDNAQLVSVALNGDKGRFLKTTADFMAPIDAGTAAVRVADLNGDGLPDIVITNYRTQNISVFLSVIPKATPTLTIQSSAAQALVGSSISISVQVKGNPTHLPTGTVTLATGTTNLGQQTLDASGNAAFALSNLAIGQYPLTATYSGDTYNNGAVSTSSSSSGAVQSVTDFQVAIPTSTQSVAAGASATYTLNLTPVAGFTGSVVLTCSGLPAGYACAPVSTTVSTQATPVSLVVTPPVTTATLTGSTRDGSRVALALLGVGGLCFSVRRRRTLPTLALFGFAIFTLGAASGCSGNGSAASKPAPYTGTSNFTITATTTQGSVTVTREATATLTVHP